MNPGRGEAEALGFVLAGGQSSRMGMDKALLEFRGRPMIAHAAGILETAGLKVHIAGARVEAAPLLKTYAPVIPDRQPGLGPLAGICEAFRSTGAELGVFLPVDTPLLPASLVLYLLQRAQITGCAVTLVSMSGRVQTFPAVISRRALPALEKDIAEGRLGCLASFQAAAVELGERIAALDTEVLVQSGQVSHPDALPVAHWFLNLNTEQDLLRAASLRATRVS